MPSPRFEVPAGAIDGSNTVFTVSRAYSPGSTAVFINGILMERSLDDGWLETTPGDGVVTLKEAPRAFDTVHVFFLDQSAPLPETQVFKMRGKIKTSTPIRGKVSMSQSITGHIVQPSPLVAKIASRKDLRATITSKQTIRAKIRVCV
jgi:hypothetical protein